MAFLVTASFAQQKKVTGTVTSKTTNAPLAGVAVQSKTGHAITDSSGKFSVNVNEGDALDIFFCRHETAKYKNICIIRQFNSST